MNNVQEWLQETMRMTMGKPLVKNVDACQFQAAQDEIAERMRKAEILEELGISTSKFSEYDDEHEDGDELLAMILVNEGKDIPEELRIRLIEKRKERMKQTNA